MHVHLLKILPFPHHIAFACLSKISWLDFCESETEGKEPFFSTSPRTLSLRFNMAPVHRGRVFSISTRYFVKLSWLNHHWLLNNVSNIWRKDFKEMIRLLNHCFQIIICQPSCELKPKSALSLQIVLPTFLKLHHFLSGWRKQICWVFWHYCVFAMGTYCTYL